MRPFAAMIAAACALTSNVAGPGFARAQDYDVFIAQQGGRLITGNGNNWGINGRVFPSEFDGDFAVNDPGYNALSAGSPSLPPGGQALPGNAALGWDFLPLTIGPSVSNLFYWNGLESDGSPGITANDVQFGGLPGPNYTLSLFGQSGSSAVDGSNTLVSGGVIEDTAADGSFHRHRFYVLRDNDGNSLTLPADGIYLFAMQLKMTDVQNSRPIYLVFGTPDSSIAALDDAAVPWVQARVDSLIPIPGDYNRDGVVDAADYVVWRKSISQPSGSLAADGNYNGQIDAGDFDVWRANFGDTIGAGSSFDPLAGSPGVAIPEPPSGLLMIALVQITLISRYRP